MKKSITLALVALLAVTTAATALAEMGDNDKPTVSVTPYLGGAFWSDDIGLDNSVIYGGRAAYHFMRHLSVEGTYGRTSADRTSDNTVANLDHWGVDLVYDILPGNKVSPYLLGGWAQLDYKTHDSGGKVPLNGLEFGVGANIRLSGDNANFRALRLEIRDVMTDLNPSFPNEGKNTHNVLATAGLQFAFGKSSRDSDGDGVRDNDDACADTPAGAVVDAAGCPVDSDGDGVYDGLDKCDGTPVGATVDAHGCPTDSDGDGVFDGLDKCPDTPVGATVDAHGCPVDSDGDGVYDGLDKCPDTPSGATVDDHGCPIPVTAMAIMLLDTGTITTNQIVFETSSAKLDPAYVGALDEIGETLSEWPALRIEIGGYTDNTGSEAFNQDLSQQRAQAVLDYLVAGFDGITAEQYTAVGYGESQPIADNGTVEGRQANRRVEFKVLNEEELQKEVETR